MSVEDLKKVFVFVGEASGDLQGAFLVREIKKIRQDIKFVGAGGHSMRSEGVDVFLDSTSMGVIGPWNAIPKIPQMLSMFNKAKKKLLEDKPDLTILIDSPAANMRLGKFAKLNGLRTLYFFPPSAWYSSTERVKNIANAGDYIIPVFEYNVKTYKKAGLEFNYFGHPLVDIVSEKMSCSSQDLSLDPSKINIAFLPGSRLQEIDSLLPVFVKTMKYMTSKRDNLHFLIPAAFPHVEKRISRYLKKSQGLSYTICQGGAYNVFKHSKFAVMASGSATLEAAIAGVPMVVVYKLAWPDWLIGKMFVKVPFFALPNLIVQKKIVPEFLQNEVNPKRIANEVFSVLDDSNKREDILKNLQDVKNSLGTGGVIKKLAEFVCSLPELK